MAAGGARDPRRARHLHRPRRARHGHGHEHRRPGHRPRLRTPHRGRHARPRPRPTPRSSAPTSAPGDETGAGRTPPRPAPPTETHGSAIVTQFLSLLLNGLSLGAIYALIALGFVIIFKASEVTSFMQGSLLLLGAYLWAASTRPLGFWGAVAVGIAGAALAALVVERLLINRLRGAPVISLAILTIGVDLIIVTELTRRIGSDILNLGHPWGGDVDLARRGRHHHEPGARHRRGRRADRARSSSTFKYSSWGISMRAAAEDGEAAALMGIRMGRVSMLAWMVAGVLAAVAGLFAVGAPTPGVTPAVATVALSALPGGDPRRPRLDRRRPGRRPADRARRGPGGRLPGPDRLPRARVRRRGAVRRHGRRAARAPVRAVRHPGDDPCLRPPPPAARGATRTDAPAPPARRAGAGPAARAARPARGAARCSRSTWTSSGCAPGSPCSARSSARSGSTCWSAPPASSRWPTPSSSPSAR